MRNFKLLFISLLLILAVFYLFSISYFELSPSEAYYWLCSQELSLGYSTHFPLISYLIFLFTLWSAGTEFSVRLGVVFFTLASLVIIFRLSVALSKNPRIGFLTTLLLGTTFGFTFSGGVATPQSLGNFFWIASLFSLYQAVFRGKKNYWYILGFSLGLGYLAQKTLFFFPPLLFHFLFLSRRYKFWLTRKELYLSLLISFLIFSPVIVWNFQHQWCNFKFLKVKGELTSKILSQGMLKFISTQFLFLSPFPSILSLFGGVILSGKILKRRDDTQWFCWVFSIPFALASALFSEFLKIETTWLSSYPLLLTGVALFHRKKWLKIGKIGIIFTIIITLLVFSYAFYPCLKLPFAWWSKFDKAVLNFRDWKELGKEVDKFLTQLPENSFIFTSSPFLASELTFYLPKRPRVYCLFSGKVSQYEAWPKPIPQTSGLYVTESKNIPLKIRNHFESFQELGVITLPWRAKKLEAGKIYLFKMTNFLSP
jgi:undecaprenyl-diphosphatase